MDAMMLRPNPTGAGRFVRNLLAALPDADRSLETIALVRPDAHKSDPDLGDRVEVAVAESGSDLDWALRGMGRAAQCVGAQVVMTLQELVGGGPVPVVVHIFEPPLYRVQWGAAGRPVKARAKDLLLAAALRGSMRRAAGVTAGSRTTATWLREHTGVAASVVYPGIDPFFLARPENERLPGERYLLHLASGDPREDSDTLLKAFASANLPDCVLVLAGSAATADGPLLARAHAVGLGGRVNGVGRVSDPRLRALYAGAVVYLHPTRYEGFGGYAALEAMAQGTPVVAFDAPGTREALEGGALFTGVGSIRGLADAMQRITRDPVLRAQLSEGAVALTRRLTWDRTATALLETLRTAMSSQ